MSLTKQQLKTVTCFGVQARLTLCAAHSQKHHQAVHSGQSQSPLVTSLYLQGTHSAQTPAQRLAQVKNEDIAQRSQCGNINRPFKSPT